MALLKLLFNRRTISFEFNPIMQQIGCHKASQFACHLDETTWGKG